MVVVARASSKLLPEGARHLHEAESYTGQWVLSLSFHVRCGKDVETFKVFPEAERRCERKCPVEASRHDDGIVTIVLCDDT